MTTCQGSWEYSWETPRYEPKEIRPEDYIIIDDTDSDPDDSDNDYVDEAGADIMESSSEQFF